MISETEMLQTSGKIISRPGIAIGLKNMLLSNDDSRLCVSAVCKQYKYNSVDLRVQTRAKTSRLKSARTDLKPWGHHCTLEECLTSFRNRSYLTMRGCACM